MKKLFLFSVVLFLLGLPLQAQNVWSVKIDTFGNYVKQSINPNANGIVSVFTPATGITVNRIELVAAGGQISCSPVPGIKLTDLTTSVSLAIPNTTATNGFTGPVHNDTGVISVPFSAGTPLFLVAIPGSSGCNPYEINITVQYSTP